MRFRDNVLEGGRFRSVNVLADQRAVCSKIRAPEGLLVAQLAVLEFNNRRSVLRVV